MTIHSEHPFRDPHTDPVRRLRGRVGATVSLWTSGGGDQPRTGLTVSSWFVVNGGEGRLVAALDPDSDLADTLRGTRRGVVQLLEWPDRDLAEAFAGLMPAPGGPFRMAEFVETGHGPRLAHATTWAAIRLEEARELGWSLLVTAGIDELEVGDAGDGLVHRGGRYHHSGDA